jgi:hypothetical protein
MRPGYSKLVGLSLAAAGLVVIGIPERSGRGDEPSRLGRLFRLGSQPNSTNKGTSSLGASSTDSPKSTILGSAVSDTTPSLYRPPGSPAAPDSGAGTRIRPQPRTTRPVTEADPLVTQISLARGDDGKQFGLFLQVYADGTVIDGTGTHRVGGDVMRPLIKVLQTGELGRFHGHCGGPPTNYLEHIQVIVYERNLGRLRANSFSYSGNPHGCDESLHKLHAALEEIQNKLNGVAAPAPATAAPPAATLPVSSPASLTAPPDAPVIPLTPGS